MASSRERSTSRKAARDAIAPETRKLPEPRESIKDIAIPQNGRVAIEAISIDIDGGRFPAKSSVGEAIRVEADIFSDGHEIIGARLIHRQKNDSEWSAAPMRFVDNDRWEGVIVAETPGVFEVTVEAWRDLFATWKRDVTRKVAAGQDVSVDIKLAMERLDKRRHALEGEDGVMLRDLADRLHGAESREGRLNILLSPDTVAFLSRAGTRADLTRHDRVLIVDVERERAGFSAWYELLPRSQAAEPGQHGTFDDVIARLPYVRDLGFDVLYFPPIHPIGRKNRKGPNNSLTAGPDDPGSPYAIGSAEGGHDALHPELGTSEDFCRLVAAARAEGLEIALDFAIQCSPDHPWISEHPEWFDWLPDGTIKFAENPPKKYEDIVNVNFYGDHQRALWEALRDVVLHWAGEGVTIFRVDNPHTKPFPFWEWMIREVRAQHPEAIFLSEAFTRPKVMKRLAKLGFTQSYSYFTWRNTKAELEEYLTELTTGPERHFMRPNFFANTPDINPYFLQTSGRPGFQIRLVLAATLSPNYGIYNGFEVCEGRPVPGKEEYLDSEKYQLRHWDMDQPDNIKDDIALINQLRREHPALRNFEALRFFNAWNDQILYYGKFDERRSSYLLFHVNLDPFNPQEADFELPLWEFGLPDDASIEVQDLVHGNRFTWHGKSHRIRLDPADRPYAIWRLFPPGAAR